MNTYYAEAYFKKGPSFSCSNVLAESVEDAKKLFLQFARSNGFTDPVKKVTVKLNVGV
jgi:hypothetical protein